MELIFIILLVIYYLLYLTYITFIYTKDKTVKKAVIDRSKKTIKYETEPESNVASSNIFIIIINIIFVIIALLYIITYKWDNNKHTSIAIFSGILFLIILHLCQIYYCNNCDRYKLNIFKSSIFSILALFIIRSLLLFINEQSINCDNINRSILCCEPFINLTMLWTYITYIAYELLPQIFEKKINIYENYNHEFSIPSVIVLCIWYFFIMLTLDGFKYTKKPMQIFNKLQSLNADKQITFGGDTMVNSIYQYSAYFTVIYIIMQYILYIYTVNSCTKWNPNSGAIINLIRKSYYNSITTGIIFILLLISFSHCRS